MIADIGLQRPVLPDLVNPFAWRAPQGPRGRLNTFIFHRVLRQPDPLLPDEPDAQRFERIVAFLARYFSVLPLPTALTALQRGTLPAAAACITFDDGYADNLEVAAPILQRYGLSATFFIATGYTGGGRMWNDSVIEAVRAAPAGELDWSDLGLPRLVVGDAPSRVVAIDVLLKALKYLDPSSRAERVGEIVRRTGLPLHSPLMMSADQLRTLRALGMDIGGHTMNHPILTRLDDAAALAEIGGGREQLTAWLGEAPRVFAYPNGVPGRDFSPRDVDLVRRCGFLGAVSTARGLARSGDDLFQLPRFTPWDRTMFRFGMRVLLER